MWRQEFFFKMFEIFVAPLASSNQRQVSAKWHQMARTYRSLAQTIRLLESTGMQWRAPSCANEISRHMAPLGAKGHLVCATKRAKRHPIGDYFAPNATWLPTIRRHLPPHSDGGSSPSSRDEVVLGHPPGPTCGRPVPDSAS